MRRVWRLLCKLTGITSVSMFLYLLFYVIHHPDNSVYNEETREILTDRGIQANNHNLDTSPAFTTLLEKKFELNHLLMFLTNLDRHPRILKRFEDCLSSLCEQTKLLVQLHIITDKRSRRKVDMLIQELKKKFCREKINVVYHKTPAVTEALQSFIKILKSIFTSGSKSYFSDSLFFLSIISHKLFADITKLIILDADLKFRTDIRYLFDEFEKFSSRNVIGLAHEQQPVYRHITWQYRRDHPGTKVGEPGPGGYPGFNSGVVLLNMDRMRASEVYQQFIEDSTLVRNLSEKYNFRGHLGDQGFYTLLGFEHPELFYVLPCTWNRQLCVWWRSKGYEGIFHLYHDCPGTVNIYHGNCNTNIPND